MSDGIYFSFYHHFVGNVCVLYRLMGIFVNAYTGRGSIFLFFIKQAILVDGINKPTA